MDKSEKNVPFGVSSERNFSGDRMFSDDGHEPAPARVQHESATSNERFVFLIFLNE